MDPTNDGNNSSETGGLEWCVAGKGVAVHYNWLSDGMLRPPGRNNDYRSGFSQSECDKDPATPPISLLTL